MYVIKVITGPLAGKSFPVKKSIKIGRKKGDILLQDSTVSDPHAEIKLDSTGRAMLLDLDSKNGIVVGEQKKVKVILKKGLEFRLGKIVFKVSVIETPEETWSSFIQNKINKVSNEEKGVQFIPFSYAAQLNFIKGPQTGESVLVTYGPRAFGKNKLDSLILDKKAKKDCFRLVAYNHEEHVDSPENEGINEGIKDGAILFQTENKEVTINNEQIAERILKQNDIIAFGTTRIKINFLNV